MNKDCSAKDEEGSDILDSGVVEHCFKAQLGTPFGGNLTDGAPDSAVLKVCSGLFLSTDLVALIKPLN